MFLSYLFSANPAVLPVLGGRSDNRLGKEVVGQFGGGFEVGLVSDP
jgi:hypothetical protein